MGSSLPFFVVNGLYVAIVVMMLRHAYSLPGEGGLVPLVIGVPTVLMALTSVLRRALAHREPQGSGDDASWRSAGTVVLWLFTLVLMVFFFGYYTSISIFTVAYLRSSGRVGWPGSLALAVILWGTVYLGFAVILERPLFEGVLFGAILPLL